MNTKNKIVSIEILKRRIPYFRRDGKKIAFTNGCFDILHFGHVRYLQAVKKNNRILIVGLNSDSSVKKIKGAKRPINGENVRAAVIAALECVDYVTIFREETPVKVIETLKPDILAKGADWEGKKIVGSDIVINNGGRVEIIKYVPGFSSTQLITSIVQKCKK